MISFYRKAYMGRETGSLGASEVTFIGICIIRTCSPLLWFLFQLDVSTLCSFCVEVLETYLEANRKPIAHVTLE